MTGLVWKALGVGLGSLAVLACLSAAPRESLACSCEQGSDAFHLESAVRHADFVFVGIVTEVATGDKRPVQRIATFLVERSWKGIEAGRLRLKAESHMCASHFAVGERYLQFGYRDGKKNHVCNGSRVFASADRAIAKLGAPIWQRKPDDRVESEAECERRGGHWGTFGLMKQHQCNLPTRDSKATCTDHRHCESVCVAEGTVPAGTATTGKCYRWTLTLGTCLNSVIDGRATGALCED